MKNTIVLIGCGNMGFAMLTGWLEKYPELDAHVVEPVASLHQRAQQAGARVVAEIVDLPAELVPKLVVLAVKPQMVDGVAAQCQNLAASGATFVSVAAGVTLDRIAQALSRPAPLIRCMPNTPASIGAGMLVLTARSDVSAETRDFVESLFTSSGAVAWIDDESLMDAVTAISGSGPAYVFYFIETLSEAGEKLGLTREIARKLALQTVRGAGQLAALSDDSPAVLREQVTSPGGTTAAALKVLMVDDGLSALVFKAATAARDRSVELGKAS